MTAPANPVAMMGRDSFSPLTRRSNCPWDERPRRRRRKLQAHRRGVPGSVDDPRSGACPHLHGAGREDHVHRGTPLRRSRRHRRIQCCPGTAGSRRNSSARMSSPPPPTPAKPPCTTPARSTASGRQASPLKATVTSTASWCAAGEIWHGRLERQRGDPAGARRPGADVERAAPRLPSPRRPRSRPRWPRRAAPARSLEQQSREGTPDPFARRGLVETLVPVLLDLDGRDPDGRCDDPQAGVAGERLRQPGEAPSQSCPCGPR